MAPRRAASACSVARDDVFGLAIAAFHVDRDGCALHAAVHVRPVARRVFRYDEMVCEQEVTLAPGLNPELVIASAAKPAIPAADARSIISLGSGKLADRSEMWHEHRRRALRLPALPRRRPIGSAAAASRGDSRASAPRRGRRPFPTRGRPCRADTMATNEQHLTARPRHGARRVRLQRRTARLRGTQGPDVSSTTRRASPSRGRHRVHAVRPTRRSLLVSRSRPPRRTSI